jgi:hypothetical protein
MAADPELTPMDTLLAIHRSLRGYFAPYAGFDASAVATYDPVFLAEQIISMCDVREQKPKVDLRDVGLRIKNSVPDPLAPATAPSRGRRESSVTSQHQITVMGDSTLFWYDTLYTNKKVRIEGKLVDEKIVNKTFAVKHLVYHYGRKYYDLDTSESSNSTVWLRRLRGLRVRRVSTGKWDPRGRILIWLDMGNSWVKKMDGPVWQMRKKEYGEIAEIAAMMFERVVYLTAGRTELQYWRNMSSDHANDYREWIISHIRRTIPRYFITDQFWRTVSTKYPHLSKSADRS